MPVNKLGGSAMEKKPKTQQIGKFHLLAVGIENYENHRKLNCVENDTNKICEILHSKYGFKINRISEADSTASRIYEELRQYTTNGSESLGDNDFLVVWLSGHGWFDSSGSDTAYFIPVDGKPSPDISNWVDYPRLKGFFRNMKANQVLLISDTCYSGGAYKDISDDTSRHPNSPELKSIQNKGRQALTSGRLELVLDQGIDGHSPFAYALLKALEGTKKEAISISQIYDKVLDFFRLNTKYSQHPQLGPLQDTGATSFGDFVFFLSDMYKNNSVNGKYSPQGITFPSGPSIPYTRGSTKKTTNSICSSQATHKKQKNRLNKQTSIPKPENLNVVGDGNFATVHGDQIISSDVVCHGNKNIVTGDCHGNQSIATADNGGISIIINNDE